MEVDLTKEIKSLSLKELDDVITIAKMERNRRIKPIKTILGV